MSTAGINFSGLATGLDTQAIISALLAVEQVPIRALQTKKTSFQKQKSQFDALQALLETLRGKADALRKSTNFLEFKAETDKPDFLTATASNSAIAGNYQIEVLALAQTEVRTSAGYADKTTDLTGTGATTLMIHVNGDPTGNIVFIGANASLEDIAAAINSAPTAGVRAQVVDTGTATDPYKLILTSETEGSAGDFTLSLDGTPSAGMLQLVTDVNSTAGGGIGRVVTGQDAQIKFGGVDVFRSSNTISDLIAGVTLSLKGVNTPGETTSLTISTDTEETSKKVKEFVDAYNAVVDFAESVSELDEDGNAKDALFGDFTVRSIRSTLRRIVGSVVNTGNLAYQMFAQIGISSDTEGKLTFEQGKFDEALIADNTAVRNLFTDATLGIGLQLYDSIDTYTDTIDGLIKARKDGFDSQIKDTERRIERAEDRLAAYEIRLTNKFAALESLVGRLQAQGSALGFFSFGA